MTETGARVHQKDDRPMRTARPTSLEQVEHGKGFCGPAPRAGAHQFGVGSRCTLSITMTSRGIFRFATLRPTLRRTASQNSGEY